MPKIKAIDVGAADIGGPHPLKNLLAQGAIELTGFEPNKKACRLLNNHSKHKFLPLYIGDGSAEVFVTTKFPAASSVYEPNIELLSKFQNLAEASEPIDRQQIFTHALDGLKECENAKYLKMDVQGAELKVLNGAKNLLSSILIIHTEVMFLEMYRCQPLFWDIAQFLENHGFCFHKFYVENQLMFGTPFRPCTNTNKPHRPLSQAIWADAIFVRDFMGLGLLPEEDLLAMAAILNDCYSSTDFVHYILSANDEKKNKKLAKKYQKWVSPPC